MNDLRQADCRQHLPPDLSDFFFLSPGFAVGIGESDGFAGLNAGRDDHDAFRCASAA